VIERKRTMDIEIDIGTGREPRPRMRVRPPLLAKEAGSGHPEILTRWAKIDSMAR